MTAHAERVRVRAAPSPTGPPHVGTAYIMLFNYVFARQQGGDVVLRIEDTDRERSSRESEEAILQSLKWIGLEWDEGPDIGGPYGPYRQSERSDIYGEYADRLREKGAAYRCFCTPQRLAEGRKTQRSPGSPPGYDRLCRGLSEDAAKEKLDAGLPYTVRLAVPLEGETRFDDLVRGPLAFQNADINDQILLKSDGYPTYHLANVVDDHLMEISHVVRAEEWISSTPKHVLLYQAFGWEPPTFIHMPLLRNKDRSKISKRRDPISMLWYRQQGFMPEALRNFLALMGWSMSERREIFTLQEMIRDFSWDRVKTSSPIFDFQKLEWMNGEYARSMPAQQLLQRILREPYTGRVCEPEEKMLAIVGLIQERIKRLAEFDELTDFFFEREPFEAQDLVPKKQDADFVRQALNASCELLKECDDWTPESLELAMRELAGQHNWKRGALYMVLRVAITCRRISTPLFETMQVLGKQECMERIELAILKAVDLH